MNLIQLSIARPVAVMSVVLMAVMFGAVALKAIPIQLAPDVSRPVITISTNWPGASPVEVEREIVNEQEDVLKGLENLESITASASDGRARVTLEFSIGTNMDRALLLTANRLDRVSSYPDEADEPTLSTAGSEDNPIAWFRLIGLPGNENVDIYTFGDFADDFIRERIERVQGVGEVNVFGGGQEEMQVIIDPNLMALHGLTVTEVVGRLRNANFAVTGGDVDEGKRRYIVRTDNEFKTLDQVKNTVLISDRSQETGRVARITVGDIATVQYGFRDATSQIRSNGSAAIAINATREVGANVIEVMDGIKQAVEDLNEGVLKDRGLEMQQVYDETIYIDSAIDLVIQNIYWGGALAAGILLIFLRSGRATLVVALAIPVSVIASFVAMAAMGRSLNVVSLAGIAFAVGMVVDAAIVVLENIYRFRQSGMSAKEAAYKGASQVWGAIFVSALTTVMVFLPILIMELEVGQLFRDIAVALSVAVLLSLVVSITVIPALSNRFMRNMKTGSDRKILPLPGIDHFGRFILWLVRKWAVFVTGHQVKALMIVGLVATSAVWGSIHYLPKLEYLPEGNRNFLFGMIFPPPGYNLDTMADIAGRVEADVMPHWASVSGAESAEGEPPKIQNFFFVATNRRTFMGASAVEDDRAAELLPILNQPIFKEPGTFGFFTQPSIFGRGVGGSRAIDLDIRGADLDEVIAVAQRAAGKVGAIFPRSEGNQLRPQPGLELGAPELRIKPHPVLLSDNGVNARDLGLTVDAYNDGVRVDEITSKGKLMDLMVKGGGDPIVQTQSIASLPVVTESGVILPLAALGDIELTTGPTEIRHRDRTRTVTLVIRPRQDIPLEEALVMLEEQVIKPLQEEGIPSGIRLQLAGTADKLQETWEELQIDLALALVIVFLVMAILFESFAYPLIIMISVPLATAGGILGLTLLNQYQYQALDMLTMLGFVILIGIVVNNAILIVHQSLHHIRNEAMPLNEAIIEATCNRVRPIYMSTLTSVVGMLPLVLVPGAGSEIYRGLGSVVVGGLALSAVVTIFVVPPLVRFFAGIFEK